MAATTESWTASAWRSGQTRLAFVGLAGLAVAARLIPLLLGGGLGFYGRYDDGVYYSAAMAVSFGRVPYRDFVLLHPPGIILVLLPFAALGRLTSDMTGMEVARIAFIVIGAVNTVFVAAIARRWSRAAMLVAGLMYACWASAIYAEESTLLEPVGGLLVLVALWLLLRRDRLPSVRAEWLAGACLGLSESIKIWYVAPWAVFIVWQLLARRSRSALRILVGGTVALAVVVVPFVIASHGQLYDYVVRDQLLRPAGHTGRLQRIPTMLGIGDFTRGHNQIWHVVAAVLIAAVVALVIACVRDGSARPVVALLVVNATVLFAAPSFFRHYESFIAAPAALVIGIGFSRSLSVVRNRRLAVGLLASATALLLASGAAYAATPKGIAFPAALRHAAPPGCVAADDPTALAEMDRLSADFRQGCRVLVDVSGVTYGSLHRVLPSGATEPRARNPAWQRYLSTYLTSASSFVIVRRNGDGLTPADRLRYRRYPVVASGGRLSLRSGAATVTSSHTRG